jgi:hypothetical protein
MVARYGVPAREKMTPPELMWPSPVANMLISNGVGKAPGSPFAHFVNVTVTVRVPSTTDPVPEALSGPPPPGLQYPLAFVSEYS